MFSRTKRAEESDTSARLGKKTPDLLGGEATRGDGRLQQKQFVGQTQCEWCDHIARLPCDLQHADALMAPEGADTLMYNLSVSERRQAGVLIDREIYSLGR